MKAKTNAIFLAKRNYSKKDKDTEEVKNMRCYDFLVFEAENDCGLVKPEVKTMIVDENDKNNIVEGLKFYENCVLVFDVVVSRDGKAYFKPIDVERKKGV